MTQTKKSKERELAKKKEAEGVCTCDKPFIAEEELGACASCNGYHFTGPHQRRGDDKVVYIICIYKNRTSGQAQTGIESKEMCEYFPKNRRLR